MVPEDWTQFSKSCTCDFSCCRSMADTKAKITEAVKPLTAELNFIAFTVQVKAGWGLTSCIPDHRDSRNMECSAQELLLICAVNFYLTCKSSFAVTHICGCLTPHLYFTGEDLEAHGRKINPQIFKSLPRLHSGLNGPVKFKSTLCYYPLPSKVTPVPETVTSISTC